MKRHSIVLVIIAATLTAGGAGFLLFGRRKRPKDEQKPGSLGQ
jgi:LPXTG-motif cell wall-anchored protein